MLERLRVLVLDIDLTDAATRTTEGEPLTAALATRDALRRRHAMLVAAADAASGSARDGYRQLRSELRWIPALPVAEGGFGDLTAARCRGKHCTAPPAHGGAEGPGSGRGGSQLRLDAALGPRLAGLPAPSALQSVRQP